MGGGGMNNNGTANLIGCSLSGNGNTAYNRAFSPVYNRYFNVGVGGGVSNGSYAKLTLTDCTVSGNDAGFGGGVFTSSRYDLTLTGFTVSGNDAGSGGGLLNRSTANLTDCTLSGNSAYSIGIGGGLLNSGTANLTDTIVAGNTDPSGASDIAGNVSGSNNLVGTGGSGGLVNGVSGNIVLTSLADLGLAPLGDKSRLASSARMARPASLEW
jgi:hypothetical protein